MSVFLETFEHWNKAHCCLHVAGTRSRSLTVCVFRWWTCCIRWVQTPWSSPALIFPLVSETDSWCLLAVSAFVSVCTSCATQNCFVMNLKTHQTAEQWKIITLCADLTNDKICNRESLLECIWIQIFLFIFLYLFEPPTWDCVA